MASSSSSFTFPSKSLFQEQFALQRSIKTLSERIDPLFPHLISVLNSQKELPLDFPELLLTPEQGRSLRSYKDSPLSATSSLFSDLNHLINALETASSAPAAKEVCEAYYSYIQQVCEAADSRSRWRLLKGEVRLIAYIHSEPIALLISRKLARQIASLSPYNQLVNTISCGTNALFHVNGLFFKREHGSALSPGSQEAAHQLAALLGNRDSPPSLLLKMKNLFVQDLSSLIAQESGSQSRLISRTELSQVATYFKSHPEEKAIYPFDERRVIHLFQVSKAIDGEPLSHLLEAQTVHRLEDRISLASFTQGFIFDLLSLPREARADHFQVSGGEIRTTNHGDRFRPPIERGRVACRSARFLLDPLMSLPLAPSYCDRLLGLDGGLVLIEWVASLVSYNESSRQLKRSHLLLKSELDQLSLPLTLSSSLLSYIHSTLLEIQRTLRNRKGEAITHWELLNHLHPSLYRVYKCLTERYPGRPLEAQKQLFSGFLKLDHFDIASPLELSAQTISEGELPPDQALQHWLASLFKDCDKKQQEKIIEQLFLSFPKLNHLHLAHLRLDESIFIKLIQKAQNLQSLTLEKSETITIEPLLIILSHSPRLSLTITESSQFSSDSIRELIEFAWELKRPLFFSIGGKSYPIQQASLDEPFKKALLHHCFQFTRALVSSGASLASTDLFETVIAQGSREVLFELAYLNTPLNQLIEGNTLLHLAVREDRADLVEALFDLGTPIREPNPIGLMGRTPLHLAIELGRVALTSMLLRFGADPLIADQSGENGLHFAIRSSENSFELAQLLLSSLPNEKAQELLRGEFSARSPLHLSVEKGDSELTRLLIAAGSDPNRVDRDHRETALHLAAKGQFLEIASQLLQAGARLDLTEVQGNTPFDYALQFHSDEIAWLFLIGSSMFFKMDSEGRGKSSNSLYSLFHSAHIDQKVVERLFWLDRLAQVHLKELKEYDKAAHLLIAAIFIAEKDPLYLKHKRYLINKLSQIELLFLQERFGIHSSPQSLDPLLEQRERLKEARLRVKEQLKGGIPPETIQRSFSQTVRKILETLINESIALLGAAPCSYAVMGLGSMAREEMAPYSDLEFAFLIKEPSPDNLDFFRKVYQALSFKIINMRETEFKFIEGEKEGEKVFLSIVPSGFSIDKGGLSPAGPYELIGSPKKLARFQKESKSAGEKRALFIVVNAMTTVCWVTGDRSLVEEYRYLSSKILNQTSKSSPDHTSTSIPSQSSLSKIAQLVTLFNSSLPFSSSSSPPDPLTNRQKRGLKLIRSAIKEFTPRLGPERIALGAFDVKKELYRSFQMIIRGLAFYHGLKTTNTLQQIDELEERGIFQKEGGKQLREVIRTTNQMRIETHLFYQESREILCYPNGSEDEKELFLISPSKGQLITKLYDILIPFHEKIKAFMNGDKKAFYSSFLSNQRRKKFDAKRNKEELAALLKSTEDAVALHPNARSHLNFGLALQEMGEVYRAVEHLEASLALSNTNPTDREVARVLAHLSEAYRELGSGVKALELCNSSLAIYNDQADLELAMALKISGSIHAQLGNERLAIDCYERSLIIYRQFYTDGVHLDIVKTHLLLAEACIAVGEETRGIEKCYFALNLCNILYGDQQLTPEIATAKKILGFAYSRLGNPSKAIDNYSSALKTLKELFEDRLHPQIVRTMIGLGESYNCLRDEARAITHYKIALEMAEQLYRSRPQPESAIALRGLGSAYLGLDDEAQAIEYYNASLEMWRQIYDNRSHPEIVKTFIKLSKAHESLGKRDLAVDFSTRALTMAKELGDDQLHPIAIESWISLGFATKHSSEAVQHFEAALELCKAIYRNQPHPHLILTLTGLGLNSRDREQALDCLTKALETSKEVEKEEPHTYVATSLRNLGYFYLYDLKEFQQAIKYYEEALDISRKIYKNRPSSSLFIPLNRIGVAYEKLGDLPKAIHHSEIALKMAREIYRERPHPRLSWILTSLSYAHEKLDELSKAIEYSEESLAGIQKLGNDERHLNIVTSLKSLNALYHKIKEYPKAIECSQKLLQIERAIHGEEPHVDVANALSLLASNLMPVNIDQSLQYFTSTLTICKQLFDNTPHQITAQALFGIGANYLSLKQPSEAIPNLESSLSMQKQLECGPHIKGLTDSTLMSLAYARGMINDLSTATLLFDSCLELIPQLYGSQSGLKIAECFARYGEMYRDCEQYERAFNCLRESLSRYDAIYGCEPHVEVAFLLETLGELYTKVGELSNAIASYERSLGIRKQVSKGQPNLEVANVLLNLGKTYANLENYDTAFKLYQESLSISKTIDPKTPDLITTLNIYYELGNSYLKIAQYDKAINIYRDFLKISPKIDNDDASFLQNRATVFNNLGVALYHLGAKHSDLSLFREALKNLSISLEMRANRLQFYKNNNSHPEIAESLRNKGRVNIKLGHCDTAVTYLTKALAMEKELSAPPSTIALILKDLIESYSLLNNPVQLVESAELLLELSPSLSERESITSFCLGHLGNGYLALGEPKKAIDYLTASLEKIGTSGTHDEIINLRISLGIALKKIKKFQSAIDIFNFALSLNNQSHKSKYNRTNARLLIELGEIYLELGNLSRSIEYYQEALVTSSCLDLDIAKISIGLGTAYVKLKKFTEAGTHFQNAKFQLHKIYKEESSIKIAELLISMGDLYKKQNKSSLAAPAYQEAYHLLSQAMGESHPQTIQAKEKFMKLSSGCTPS